MNGTNQSNLKIITLYFLKLIQNLRSMVETLFPIWKYDCKWKTATKISNSY